MIGCCGTWDGAGGTVSWLDTVGAGPEHQVPQISSDTSSNRQPMNGDPSHVHDFKAEIAEIALIVSFLVLGRRGAVCSGSLIAHVIGCECSISSSSKVQ